MPENRITGNSSRTIIRQQQQEDQKHEEKSENPQEDREKYQNTRSDYYYNNYYPTRARACAREATTSDELPPAEIMGQIALAYHENISEKITKVAAGIIERALKNGMEPATVILAIEETGMASRPSPYYLSAVLRNWAENGVVLSRSKGGADVRTTDARPWWR